MSEREPTNSPNVESLPRLAYTMAETAKILNEPKSDKKQVPCFLCGTKAEVRYSKKGKPYLVCDPCGVQIFIRGRRGIELFRKIQDSFKNELVVPETNHGAAVISLLTRLSELRTKKKEIEDGMNFLEALCPDDTQKSAIRVLDSEIQTLEAEIQNLDKK